MNKLITKAKSLTNEQCGALISIFISVAVGTIMLFGAVIPAFTNPDRYFAMVDERLHSLFGFVGASSWYFYVLASINFLVALLAWLRTRRDTRRGK